MFRFYNYLFYRLVKNMVRMPVHSITLALRVCGSRHPLLLLILVHFKEILVIVLTPFCVEFLLLKNVIITLLNALLKQIFLFLVGPLNLVLFIFYFPNLMPLIIIFLLKPFNFRNIIRNDNCLVFGQLIGVDVWVVHHSCCARFQFKFVFNVKMAGLESWLGLLLTSHIPHTLKITSKNLLFIMIISSFYYHAYLYS